MFQSRLIFQSLAVTKPVVTQISNGYQMKDLDNIFPLRPYGLLYFKQFGCYSLLNLGIFRKIKKVLKIHNFWQGWNLDFWTLFFQNTLIQRWIKIFSWNQAIWSQITWIFMWSKQLFDIFIYFRVIQNWKLAYFGTFFSRFLRDDSPVLPCSTIDGSLEM